MSTEAEIELLAGMPIFGGLRDDVLAAILARARRRAVEAGRFFFWEGDPADATYALEAGRVAVVKRWHDREFVLRHLGPGDCFGELSLIDLGRRSASVRAEEDCRALELGVDVLQAVYRIDVEQYALLYLNMARELARRLRTATDAIFRAQLAGGAADAFEEPLIVSV